MYANSATLQRHQRHKRVRAKISGSRIRPRLAVFRSSSHISAQLIDDEAGETLMAAHDALLEKKDLSGTPKDLSRKAKTAYAVGRLLADRAKTKGILRIVFDRGGFRFHGRVKALAEGARTGGLEF